MDFEIRNEHLEIHNFILIFCDGYADCLQTELNSCRSYASFRYFEICWGSAVFFTWIQTRTLINSTPTRSMDKLICQRELLWYWFSPLKPNKSTIPDYCGVQNDFTLDLLFQSALELFYQPQRSYFIQKPRSALSIVLQSTHNIYHSTLFYSMLIPVHKRFKKAYLDANVGLPVTCSIIRFIGKIEDWDQSGLRIIGNLLVRNLIETQSIILVHSWKYQRG